MGTVLAVDFVSMDFRWRIAPHGSSFASWEMSVRAEATFSDLPSPKSCLKSEMSSDRFDLCPGRRTFWVSESLEPGFVGVETMSPISQCKLVHRSLGTVATSLIPLLALKCYRRTSTSVWLGGH